MLGAAFGIAGGVFEIAVGVSGEVFSGGLSTALVVDGLARVVGNTAKAAAYLNRSKEVGNAIPGNYGALLGKIMDGSDFHTIGKAQSALGLANDVLVIISPAGDAGAISDFAGEMNVWNGTGVLTGYFGGTAGLKGSIGDVKEAYGK